MKINLLASRQPCSGWPATKPFNNYQRTCILRRLRYFSQQQSPIRRIPRPEAPDTRQRCRRPKTSSSRSRAPPRKFRGRPGWTTLQRHLHGVRVIVGSLPIEALGRDVQLRRRSFVGLKLVLSCIFGSRGNSVVKSTNEDAARDPNLGLEDSNGAGSMAIHLASGTDDGVVSLVLHVSPHRRLASASFLIVIRASNENNLWCDMASRESPSDPLNIFPEAELQGGT